MTAEKAIEILEMSIPEPESVSALDSIDAMQLGVEALKMLLAIRKGDQCYMEFLLPSETS